MAQEAWGLEGVGDNVLEIRQIWVDVSTRDFVL